MDAAAVRQRLREECDRAVRNQQRVTLLHVEFGVAETDSTYVLNQLKSHLRPFDAVATLNKGQLMIIVASLSTEDISELVSALLTSLPATARDWTQLMPDRWDRCGYPVAHCAPNGPLRGSFAPRGPESIPQRRLIGKHDVIIADPAMLRTYELLERLAPSQLPVLIHGETGSGKDRGSGTPSRVASKRTATAGAKLRRPSGSPGGKRAVWSRTRRVFGREFTESGTAGKCTRRDAVLDELADLSLGVQAKLLRALELAGSCVSVTPKNARSTFVWWPRPIATSKRKSKPVASAKTCISGCPQR